jgi:hypothetical protein
MYVSFPYLHIHHPTQTHTHTQVPEAIVLKINKIALLPNITTLTEKYMNNIR